MAKKLYTRPDANDHSTSFLTGKVVEVRLPNKDSKSPTRVIIKTKLPERGNDGKERLVEKEIELNAWEDRARRLENMRFTPGSFAVFRIGDITTYTPRTGPDILQAQYWSSMYTGYWDIDDPDHEEMVIVSGIPSEIKENSDGSVVIDVKARGFVDGSKQDLFFKFLISAKKYSNMKKKGFVKNCTIVGVGTMVDDESLEIGSIDFEVRQSRGGSNGSHGSGRGTSSGRGSSRSSRSGSARKWGGSTGFGPDEDDE